MAIHLGEVAALYRYPVKSMAGERLDAADVGWHGVSGDRRLALRRLEERGGFPWLTASKLPDLLRYVPARSGTATPADLPNLVRTPDGSDLPLFGPELMREIGRRHGSPVEMMYLDRGIFDEASLSLIASATVAEVARLASVPPDVRRFRPNLLIATLQAIPFEEDEWVGGLLSFGEGELGPSVAVTNHDERCSMVNFDPDTARATPEVLKTIVGARNNRAGVYGAVTRRGRIRVGDPVFFRRA
jgi:uncharacterized protein YcbX